MSVKEAAGNGRKEQRLGTMGDQGLSPDSPLPAVQLWANNLASVNLNFPSLKQEYNTSC